MHDEAILKICASRKTEPTNGDEVPTDNHGDEFRQAIPPKLRARSRNHLAGGLWVRAHADEKLPLLWAFNSRPWVTDRLWVPAHPDYRPASPQGH